MCTRDALDTAWLAEKHDKLSFLELNLLKLTPISGLVLGEWEQPKCDLREEEM